MKILRKILTGTVKDFLGHPPLKNWAEEKGFPRKKKDKHKDNLDTGKARADSKTD